MADPTPREVTDFDRSLKEGDELRNKYQEHENPPGSRIIRILNKMQGNIVEYWVVERHRQRELEPNIYNTFTMSTKNLLENYEFMPELTGEEPNPDEVADPDAGA